MLLLLAAAAAAVGWWLTRPSVTSDYSLPTVCRKLAFEYVDYVACDIDPARHDIRLFRAAAGKAYGSLDAFDQAMAGERRPVLMAMNAGMYHEDLSPVGLYVEGGRTVSPVETRDGEGNFFLKPNGVFLVAASGRASILETNAYVAAAPAPAYATQSGPLLAIGGRLHPKFDENGKSRHVRNGVGIRSDGTVVFAISLSEVSLGSFARLFRDGLGCPDALYLDGVVSALSNGAGTIIGGKYPAGPIVAVLPRPQPIAGSAEMRSDVTTPLSPPR
jgi:uncharacterized protein YigE (DUF2233 family)